MALENAGETWQLIFGGKDCMPSIRMTFHDKIDLMGEKFCFPQRSRDTTPLDFMLRDYVGIQVLSARTLRDFIQITRVIGKVRTD